MALTFIDRTPPIYEGGELNKDTMEAEIRNLRSHILEMGNYLAYMREMENYNLNQLGAVSPSEGEGGNP